MILLTKSSVLIIGQVASIMGWIMDGIYRVLDLVGIQNLGLLYHYLQYYYLCTDDTIAG